MTSQSKHRSRDLVDGPSRAPARAMLKAVGFTDDDLSRPLVGVANTWIEVMPCNYHLRRLSEKVKAGIRAGGGASASDGVLPYCCRRWARSGQGTAGSCRAHGAPIGDCTGAVSDGIAM